MILVTGGAGFIGSNLVASLEQNGVEDIVICDQLGMEQKWRNISKRDLFDVISPKSLNDFIEENSARIVTVFHLGAISTTTEKNADLILENNFRVSCKLWSQCAKYRIPFIYASSAATYGDGSLGFNDISTRAHLASLTPLNPYGWSKNLFDRWVAKTIGTGSAAQTPPQWAGLKFFNVYGPNEYHKQGQISVVLKNYREIKAGGPAILFRSHNPEYKDGEQSRDFIWVGDCIDILIWLSKTQDVSGLFNVGTGISRSFNDMAKTIFDRLNLKPEIKFIDTPVTIREHYQYFTKANITRLRDAGYNKKFTSLEEGVSQYISNFLETTDPYI
ncbi:MAG: ADP-glyceromanno-heptose 6-epimerase [Rhodospirillales bacterium]|nr:ADP-glyceromanno-heptose 6-epimerase [Rhodospirillales bacterium]